MRRWLPWTLTGVGLVLVLAGVVVTLVADRAPVAHFGWATYAPLEQVDVAYAARSR
jgi:hypothetical protein